MNAMPRTVWQIRSIGRPADRSALNIELVIDTTAPAVVEMIEFAAAEHGIVLERVGAEEEK